MIVELDHSDIKVVACQLAIGKSLLRQTVERYIVGMTPIHEIGFLILSGALSCWQLPKDIPCAGAERIEVPVYQTPSLAKKPAAILKRGDLSGFVVHEVDYEETGIAVFKIEGDSWKQIRKSTGENLWLYVPRLLEQLKQNEKKASGSGEASGVSFKSLAEVLTSSLLDVTEDFAKNMRKADLKTPVPLSHEAEARIRARQLQEKGLAFPDSSVEVIVNCQFQSSADGSGHGTCDKLPSISAYVEPKAGAAKMEIVMSPAQWAGEKLWLKDISRSGDRLYIFGAQGDWLKIRIVVGPEERRTRWIRKADLGSRTIRSMANGERIAAVAKILESEGRPDDARALVEPVRPGFKATGQSKWSADGVLWLEVELEDIPPCEGTGTPKALMKVWLPYRLPMSPRPIVNWSPRGC